MSTKLLKVDPRPDGSIELQYASSSVPVAVMVHNGTGTHAVADMIARAVNEYADLCAVRDAAKAASAVPSALGNWERLDQALTKFQEAKP